MQYMNIISIVTSIVPIILALAATDSIKNAIREKRRFNGIAWGVALGITGAGLIGIVCAVLAHSSINKELEMVKNERYAKRAKEEMRTFIKAFFVSLVLTIVLAGVVLSSGIMS